MGACCSNKTGVMEIIDEQNERISKEITKIVSIRNENSKISHEEIVDSYSNKKYDFNNTNFQKSKTLKKNKKLEENEENIEKVNKNKNDMNNSKKSKNNLCSSENEEEEKKSTKTTLEEKKLNEKNENLNDSVNSIKKREQFKISRKF